MPFTVRATKDQLATRREVRDLLDIKQEMLRNWIAAISAKATQVAGLIERGADRAPSGDRAPAGLADAGQL
ncbi:hypothetical protein [Pseudactinotalea sp.]|uniref:hypothetical protein n=1 Tax=Pseudactinotalea sp. TaxID=1926260 RepID=UPI003B3AFA85